MDKTATVRVLTMVAQGLENGMSKKAEDRLPIKWKINPLQWWGEEAKKWMNADPKTRLPSQEAGRLAGKRYRRLDDAQFLFENNIRNSPRRGIFFGKGRSPSDYSFHTQNVHNEIANSMYEDATVARGNRPYSIDDRGNYTEAYGKTYK